MDASSTLGLDVKATGGVTVRLSRKGLAQPSYDVYEAEDGVLGGSATMDNDSKGNCSGGKMVGFIGRGGTVTLNGVKAEKSGVYDMTLFYVSNEERETYYCVNGGEKHYVSFPKNNVSWDSEGLAIKTVQVELSEGDNSIEFGNDRNYGVNIDRIMVSPLRKCAKVSIESMPNFADGAVLSDDEPVKMKIRNNSPSDITGVKVSYVLTSGSGPEQSAVQDVLGIAGGATVDVTFDRSLDLSAVASYNLQISILDNADNNIVGDMKSVTFSRVPEQDGTSISLASNGGKIHSFSSQTGDSESAAKLIDNDLSTKWCDNNSSKPWVILELPDLYEVDKFVMWDCKTKEENYRNIDQYVVSVSTESPDKGEWTEVTNTKNRKCENVKVDEFASQKARYVKLEARRPDDDNAVRVYGFDVYGTLCTGVEGVVKSDDTLSFVSGALHCTGEKPCAVRVYGIDGKAVMSFVIEAGETMKLDLPEGVYTVVTSFGQAMKVMF